MVDKEDPKISTGELELCNLAIAKRFITLAQFQECQEIQKKIAELGVKKSITAILQEKKYITEKQIESLQRADARRSKELGDYQLISKLGQGGMGVVYKAYQQRMNRTIALKILHPRLAKNDEFISRFYREARLAAKLNHVNIVSAIDVGQVAGYHYFAMEYVKHKSLSRLIREKKTIPEEEALHIIIQVTRALQHADEHKMIHRDVKPQNILIMENGVAKLADLGLAKSTTGDDASLTQTGMSVGTPHYISPEQALGKKDVDIRSDIYSLGATLYHMVTGETPFKGSTAVVIMTKHLTEKIPNLSDATCRIIKKMTAKKAPNRYQTPQELSEDLKLAIDKKSPGTATSAAGKPAVQPAVPQMKQPVTPKKQRRRRAIRPRPKGPIPLLIVIGFTIVTIFVCIPILKRALFEKQDNKKRSVTVNSPKRPNRPPPVTIVLPGNEASARKLYNQAMGALDAEEWFKAENNFTQLEKFRHTKFYQTHENELIGKKAACQTEINKIIIDLAILEEQRKGYLQFTNNWSEALKICYKMKNMFTRYRSDFEQNDELRLKMSRYDEYIRRYEREIEVMEKLARARSSIESNRLSEARGFYRNIKADYKNTQTARSQLNYINEQLIWIDKKIQQNGR